MLTVKGLHKEYQTFSLDCTLEVKPGRITGLVGRNGAGKSTTFKCILGLVAPDGGEIELFGKNISAFTANDKEQIGVVLSDSGFSGYLTAKDVIVILRNFYAKFDEAWFREQLEKCQLPLNQKLNDYSTGMKAKLKVLSAISHRAKLLILDEPTAGLDVIARDEILQLLREYLEENEERSILISSHISSDLESLCDDIYMIEQGQILLHEDTDILLSEYGVLNVDEQQFQRLDRRYLLRCLKDRYSYRCLTNQKQYYRENHPDLVMENGTIDNVITLMMKGERL